MCLFFVLKGKVKGIHLPMTRLKNKKRRGTEKSQDRKDKLQDRKDKSEDGKDKSQDRETIAKTRNMDVDLATSSQLVPTILHGK